jgi:phospholipid/cholesterol/gamma-HCH transport system substrate-binding protein
MPQQKQASLASLRVGLMVIAAIAIIILVIFAVSGDINLFRRSALVKTYMSSADGLRQGAEVRLSGVQVGSVKEINFTPNIPADPSSRNYIEILLEIDGRIDGVPAIQRIRSDSLAVLKGAGVLGDNVIDITPGTQQGQPIQDGGTINSVAQKSVADIINASQTAVSNLNEISSDIKEVTEDIREGRGTVGKLLRDEKLYVDLDRAILEAENLITAVKRGDGTAGRLISDPALYNQANAVVADLKRLSEQVNEQINAGRGTIGKLLKDEELYNRANALVAKFDQTANRFENIVARTERGEGTVGKLLKEEQLYNETRQAVASLRVLAAGLEKGEGTAGRLLKDEQLYNNLNQTSAEITKLIYDFRQNPRKYLSVKVSIF